MGWLTNPERLERRDDPNTLLDHDVKKMIETIGSLEVYSKEDPEVDAILRMRDQAMIATAWTWFKRGGEDLRVRLGKVFITEKDIGIMFSIEKKSKSFRLCPYCEEKGRPTKNAKRANYCKNCGKDIKAVELTKTHPAPVIKTKRKTLRWPFCKYIVAWVEQAKKMGAPEGAYLFPPYRSFSGTWDWFGKNGKPMSIQRLDQILQRIDPTTTSSFFRYGHTEKLQRMGKSNTQIAVIGDWESDRMPSIYGKRKGITPEETEFAEDTTQL